MEVWSVVLRRFGGDERSRRKKAMEEEKGGRGRGGKEGWEGRWCSYRSFRRSSNRAMFFFFSFSAQRSERNLHRLPFFPSPTPKSPSFFPELKLRPFLSYSSNKTQKEKVGRHPNDQQHRSHIGLDCLCLFVYRDGINKEDEGKDTTVTIVNNGTCPTL